MGADGSEQAGTHTMMIILLIGYMLSSSHIAELLRKAKIDDVNEVRVFACTHHEIGWLDVTMDKIARVNVFYAGNLQDNAREGGGIVSAHENAWRA